MRLVGFSSVALIGVERGVADLRAIPVTAGLPRSHTALGRLLTKNGKIECALSVGRNETGVRKFSLRQKGHMIFRGEQSIPR